MGLGDRFNATLHKKPGLRKFFIENSFAIAVSRAIIAVLENFQQPDGSVRLPKALVPYCGFELIQRKR